MLKNLAKPRMQSCLYLKKKKTTFIPSSTKLVAFKKFVPVVVVVGSVVVGWFFMDIKISPGLINSHPNYHYIFACKDPVLSYGLKRLRGHVLCLSKILPIVTYLK